MGRFEQLNIIVTIGYINLSLHPGYSYQKLYKTIVTKGYINLSKKLEKSGTSCNVFNKIKKNDRKSFRKNYESNPDLSSMKKVRRHSSARTRVLK